MSVRIKVCKDGAIINQIALTPLKTITIGRRQDADIPIEHPSASRQHATLVLNAQGPVITDCGSAHGTFKNKQQLPAQQPTKLKDGDVVTFGQSSRSYIVSIGADVKASQPSGQTTSVPKEEPAPQVSRGFNPLMGSSGGPGLFGAGLNTGGKLASVLAMIDKEKESGYKRKERDGGGVVDAYTKKEMRLSGQGLEAMAARAERDHESDRRQKSSW